MRFRASVKDEVEFPEQGVKMNFLPWHPMNDVFDHLQKDLAEENAWDEDAKKRNRNVGQKSMEPEKRARSTEIRRSYREL